MAKRLNAPALSIDTAPRRLSAAGLGAGRSTRVWSFSALAGWKLGEQLGAAASERQPRLWWQLAHFF
ncbi:hypothetical protein [Pseudomonas putida]|uniref:hypothetical protein n=1 Tax=Pseudomonas putida TaxID=303 RepID=UPI000952D7C8|nr:hypothetical protein [Pseudomonas putida]